MTRYLPLLLVSVGLSLDVSADVTPNQYYQEDAGFISACMLLDRYLEAGSVGDSKKGAKLLSIHEKYRPLAESETRRIYRKHSDRLARYKSIGSEVYGYEFKKGPLQSRASLEGFFTSESGSKHEIYAKLIYRNRKWSIVSVSMD